MTCVATFLAAAVAGLNPGTCALSCSLPPQTTVWVSDHVNGYVSPTRGERVEVHRVNGEWRWIVEQMSEQCLKGGAKW